MSLSCNLCHLGYFLFSLWKNSLHLPCFQEEGGQVLGGKAGRAAQLAGISNLIREMMFLPEEAQCHQEGITQTGVRDSS